MVLRCESGLEPSSRSLSLLSTHVQYYPINRDICWADVLLPAFFQAGSHLSSRGRALYPGNSRQLAGSTLRDWSWRPRPNAAWTSTSPLYWSVSGKLRLQANIFSVTQAPCLQTKMPGGRMLGPVPGITSSSWLNPMLSVAEQELRLLGDHKGSWGSFSS